MEDFRPIQIKTISSIMWQLSKEFLFLSNFSNSKTRCSMLVLFFSLSFFKSNLMGISIILTPGLVFWVIRKVSHLGVNFSLKPTMKILTDPILQNTILSMETDWNLCGRTDQIDLSRRFILIQLKKAKKVKRVKRQKQKPSSQSKFKPAILRRHTRQRQRRSTGQSSCWSRLLKCKESRSSKIQMVSKKVRRTPGLPDCNNS